MVSDAESLEFYLLVVIFNHLLLVLGHSLRGLISNFVQAIQIQLQLVVITIFAKELLSQAGDSYLNGDATSIPYARLKGVSPVGVLAVVR